MEFVKAENFIIQTFGKSEHKNHHFSFTRPLFEHTHLKNQKNVQEDLKSPRLLLRSLNLEDADDLLNLRYHPEVLKYIRRDMLTDKDDIKTYIKERLQDIIEDCIYYWVISNPENSKLMGTICLWNFNDLKTVAEIGYELHPNYHRKGFMSEAMTAVLNFGFKELQLISIEAYTNKDNEESKKLLNAFDFKLDADRKDDGFPDNLIYIKDHA